MKDLCEDFCIESLFSNVKVKRYILITNNNTSTRNIYTKIYKVKIRLKMIVTSIYDNKSWRRSLNFLIKLNFWKYNLNFQFETIEISDRFKWIVEITI